VLARVRVLALLLLPLCLAAALGRPVAADTSGASPDTARFGQPYASYQKAVAAGDLEDAAVHARRAYRLAEEELGPDDIQTGILAYNVGAVSLQLGRYSDSATALENAARIYGLRYGQYDARTLAPVERLAESQQRLGRSAAAEEHYVRAVEIIERTRGRGDHALGPILISLVDIATDLEEWKRARTYGRRAIGVLTPIAPEDAIPLGLLHVRLASNELVLGDAHQAAKHMDAGIEILEVELAADDKRWGRIYVVAAQTYGFAGRSSTSRRYKRNARKLGYEVPEPKEKDE
jgi:tetratricopeptide (TPR) repeat protein